ncbi:MAG: flippase-like domain-containing protein [Myxococcales bacterium]|nr:flippase-like domain-containing protein [Myxococcales bacterium]
MSEIADEVALPAETAGGASRGRRRWLHALALIVGIVGLVLLIHNAGWHTLASALAHIGPWFAVIAVIDLGAILCDAGALHAYARAHAPVSYGRVFAAQASGVAINRLTPGNALGEPIKVTLLMAEVPRDVAVSSVVKFNLATSWVAIAVILLGIPLTLLSLDLPSRLAAAVWIAAFVLAAFAIALVVIVRRGAIGVAIGGAQRIGLVSAARAARWRTAVGGIDAQIKTVGSRRAFLFVIASRLLFSTGSIALIAAAGIPLTLPLALATVSVGILITWISNIVPLGVGLADGGNYALYGALGATGGAGLLYTMVNRARVIVLALLGLSIMAYSTTLTGAPSTPRWTVASRPPSTKR